MKCAKCKGEAKRLYASGHGLLGECCFEDQGSRDWTGLHKIRLNRWGVKMTWADAMRIKTNAKRADGQFRPEPRWQTTGD